MIEPGVSQRFCRDGSHAPDNSVTGGLKSVMLYCSNKPRGWREREISAYRKKLEIYSR